MIIKHRVTGGVYVVICESRNEAKPDETLVTYMNVETGAKWTRVKSQIFDGRFQLLDDDAVQPDLPRAQISHHPV